MNHMPFIIVTMHAINLFLAIKEDSRRRKQRERMILFYISLNGGCQLHHLIDEGFGTSKEVESCLTRMEERGDIISTNVSYKKYWITVEGIAFLRNNF
jgi:predicted transcriptional regulator